MSMDDPYGGTPKYSTASDIYEALQSMERGEEIGILGEMFEDVSWDGQDYYYTDNGGKLVDKWDALTDGGDKLWTMEVAIFQIEERDANDMFYDVLYNDDLSKRIGFKKIFIDIALRGNASQYQAAAEAFFDELSELDRFNYWENLQALERALKSAGVFFLGRPYDELCTAVHKKLTGLRLDAERQLIVESRAMLASYDDFMFGLRANQQLYTEQGKLYANKAAALQERYDSAMQGLLLAAQMQGVALELPQIKILEETGDV